MDERPKTVKTRMSYIDIAKGIGIYSVVLVHFTSHGSWLSQILLAFCVPFFFIVSGILFSVRRPPKAFVLNLIQKLLIPLLLYGLIDVGFSAFRYWVMEGKAFEVKELLSMLLRVTFVTGKASSNGPLWFLVTLMEVQLLMYPLLRFGSKYLFYAATVLMFASAYFVHAGKIFRIVQIPSAFVLFALGVMIRPLVLHLSEKPRLTQAAVFLVSTAIFAVSCWCNGLSETAARNFGNVYPLYYVTAMAVTFSLLSVSLLIGKSRILEFYGKSSLTIMCCHYYFAVYIFVWILGAIGCAELRASIPFEILLSIVTMLLMYPIVRFIDRYCTALTGKRALRYLPQVLDGLHHT